MSRFVRENSEYLIGEAIQKMLEETHLARPYMERRIAQDWRELMGPLARHTVKTEWYDETFFVYVDSPIVKQELNLLREEILRKMQQSIGNKYLKKLVIR